MQRRITSRRGLSLAGVLAGLALGSQLALVAPAGAVIVRTRVGHVVSYQPTAPRAAAARAAAGLLRGQIRTGASTTNSYAPCQTTEPACLAYEGGPVMVTATLTPIFWNPSGLKLSWPSASYETEVDRFFTDLTADNGKETNFFSVLTQYYELVAGSPRHVAYSVTAGAPLKDTDPLPSGSSEDQCTTPFEGSGRPCVSDLGVRTELESFIASNSLPRGLGHEYVVFFPNGMDSCFGAGGTGSEECSGTGYCGYHSTIGSGTQEAQYANEPENADPAFQGTCTAVSGLTAAATTLNTASHEISESITDPEVGAHTAWYDVHTFEVGGKQFEYGEVGDMCAWEFKQGDQAASPTFPVDAPGTSNQTINNDPYLLQTEWDNAHSTCSLSQGATTTASFTHQPATPAQTGESISFDASASKAPTAIETYEWTWGDGSAPVSTKSSTVTHEYTSTQGQAVKTFTVTLKVTDSKGNTATANEPVEVRDRKPTASLEVATASPTAGQPVLFDGSASSDVDGTVASYSWNFGDGSPTATGATTSHTYTAPGSHTVTLTVTDNAGLTAEVSTQVTVADAPPTATFTSPGLGTAGTALTFDGSASSDLDGSVSYSWNFGDGSAAASGAAPSHTYAAAGEYTVILTVTDNAGLVAHVSHAVTVLAAPSTASTTSSTPTAPPSNVLVFGAVRSNRDGSVDVKVRVPAAGLLSAHDAKAGLLTRFAQALGLNSVLDAPMWGQAVAVQASKGHKSRHRKLAGGPLVDATSLSVGGPQEVTLHLIPTAHGRSELAKRHKVSVSVTIVFAPTGGTAASVRRTYVMTLASAKKKRRH